MRARNTIRPHNPPLAACRCPLNRLAAVGEPVTIRTSRRNGLVSALMNPPNRAPTLGLVSENLAGFAIRRRPVTTPHPLDMEVVTFPSPRPSAGTPSVASRIAPVAMRIAANMAPAPIKGRDHPGRPPPPPVTPPAPGGLGSNSVDGVDVVVGGGSVLVVVAGTVVVVVVLGVVVVVVVVVVGEVVEVVEVVVAGVGVVAGGRVVVVVGAVVVGAGSVVSVGPALHGGGIVVLVASLQGGIP